MVAVWIIAIVATVFVVVVVLGLHVWGAIQDGREEQANWQRRHPAAQSGDSPMPPAKREEDDGGGTERR